MKVISDNMKEKKKQIADLEASKKQEAEQV